MTISDKAAYIANFNCTFGDQNEPMLMYFFEVILPAFMNKNDETKEMFIFENVKLTNVKGEFVLAGIIVKRTTLEVKSRYIDGKLVRTNEVYPSDPYSYFLINLKNHRMVLVKNQKGSPTLNNFSKTTNNNIKRYINNINMDRDEKKKIPEVHLNVVAIPFEGTIVEELKKVEKIRNVILRFYPLNGDIFDNETAQHLADTLVELGSKTGSITYNTPDNKKNVAQVIRETKGLMKPTIRVEFKDGTKGTLRDGSFTEIMSIPLDELETFEKNIDTIAGKMNQKKEFNETSEENQKIYHKFFTQLESWYNKMLK